MAWRVYIPLLNGNKQVPALIEEFVEERVIGGMFAIESTLDQSGKIIQTSALQEFVYGERNGKKLIVSSATY